MTAIALETAQKELDALTRRAQAGEEIVIVNGTEPAAKLVAVGNSKASRTPGALRGQIRLPDSFFFEPFPDEVLASWHK